MSRVLAIVFIGKPDAKFMRSDRNGIALRGNWQVYQRIRDFNLPSHF